MLLADYAVGLGAMLKNFYSPSIAWNEDYAFLHANDKGKPLGIQNWAGLIFAPRTTSSKFKLADVASMFSRLRLGSDERTICVRAGPVRGGQLLALGVVGV